MREARRTKERFRVAMHAVAVLLGAGRPDRLTVRQTSSRAERDAGRSIPCEALELPAGRLRSHIVKADRLPFSTFFGVT